VRTYSQTLVHPDDIQTIVITSPFGLFELPFMSFGLRNAAQTFKLFMDDILRGQLFCFAYLDIRTARAPPTGSLRPTSKVRNPHLPGEIFRAPTVTFLDYKASAEGSQPLEKQVANLYDCHPPETARQLRRFLGMPNFCTRFLPLAEATKAPLPGVLSGPGKPDTVKSAYELNGTVGTPSTRRSTQPRQ
jgi:hypothetical protein